MNLRMYEMSGNPVFKQNGFQTLQYVFKEFYKDGYFYQRPISLDDSHQFKNIHVNIFDQSFKSPLGTLILLIRKWSTVIDLTDFKNKIQNIQETLTHLSLQNPLGFGETLRALTYPDEAFRKIEVPISWLQEENFMRFIPNFSIRFTLTYQETDKESWQVCNLKECEHAGKGIDSFIKIFEGSEEVKQ